MIEKKHVVLLAMGVLSTSGTLLVDAILDNKYVVIETFDACDLWIDS